MVKVCVVGCLHGELAKMYEDIRETELKYGYKVDIVLCCGDFQSVRNESDLTVMSVPPKYRRLGDFWKYYSGEIKTPYLTVFVGGNHEASNYLQELPYGGWVAPDIFYLGYAGVVNFCGLRIAGMSGIYKRHDYYTGHYEHAPYDDQSKRTAYHVRNIETFRMTQIKSPIDIVLSHDWPRGIYNYSNQLPRLLKQKPYFEEEMKENVFGSPAGEEILSHLKPRYWFAAHHHCKFTAHVQFTDSDNATTKFLALDKCLPRKNYLQILDIEPRNDVKDDQRYLSLDPEWLCVLRATNHLMSITKTVNIMPTEMNQERCDFSASKDDLKELTELFNNQFKIPENFETTAPIHTEEYFEASNKPKPVEIFANPQTDLLCAMLDLVNPNGSFIGSKLSLDDMSKKLRKYSSSSEEEEKEEDGCDSSSEESHMDASNGRVGLDNPEEIDLGDEEEEDEVNMYVPQCGSEEIGNPEKIDIEEDECEDGKEGNMYVPLYESEGIATNEDGNCKGGQEGSSYLPRYDPEIVSNPEKIDIEEDECEDGKEGSVYVPVHDPRRIINVEKEECTDDNQCSPMYNPEVSTNGCDKEEEEENEENMELQYDPTDYPNDKGDAGNDEYNPSDPLM